MAVTVKASLGKTKYYTEVTAGDNKIITDEPIDLGGENKGFNPFEVLALRIGGAIPKFFILINPSGVIQSVVHAGSS